MAIFLGADDSKTKLWSKHFADVMYQQQGIEGGYLCYMVQYCTAINKQEDQWVLIHRYEVWVNTFLFSKMSCLWWGEDSGFAIQEHCHSRELI